MLRSMYAGVSGLRAHQNKLDVIGNNIANVNTSGYKKSRVTFKSALTQTMRGATQPYQERGGTNPMQVGLGVTIGSIDTDMSAGNAQSTGKMTDISIEGNGFFVVNEGDRSYYSRAGAFSFDRNGNFVHAPTGFRVQGWMADKQGEFKNTNSSSLEALSLGDPNMSPKATSFINYKGNLDATKEVADLSYGPESITVSDSGGNSAELKVELNKTSGAGTPERADDKWTWSASTTIPGSESLGAVTAAGGPVSLTSPPALPAGSSYGSYNFNKFVEGSLIVKDGGGNTLAEGTDYTVDYAAGTIDFNNDYASIDVSFKHEGKIHDGSITLDKTGAVASNSITDFNFDIYDNTGAIVSSPKILAPQVGDDNGGLFTADPSLTDITSGTIEGEYGPVKSTSTKVYDSLGNTYDINVSYVKTAENQWDWFAEGPKGITLTNNSGTIKFDSQGNVMGTPTGGPISFKPANADLVTVEPDFSGVTQFSAEDTVDFERGDGYAAGNLTSFTLDATGTVIGNYSNGRNKAIAKIAIATFSNAAGLERNGNTVFTESENSGTASIGTAGAGSRGQVNPGTLEMSNVDLAEEFTEMISTQRGFQANSKIISTSDQILQDLVNLKR